VATFVVFLASTVVVRFQGTVFLHTVPSHGRAMLSSLQVMAGISFKFNSGVLIATVERSVVTSTVHHLVAAMFARMMVAAIVVTADVLVVAADMGVTAGMMAVVVTVDVATRVVVSRVHRSMGYSSRSLWLPRVVSVTVTLESGVTLVFRGDGGTTLNFIETFKVDVLQVGHGDVLHVSVVESALGTVHVSVVLLVMFLMNCCLWGRSGSGRAGWGLDFLNDLRDLHGSSEVNFLLATDRSADNHQADHDGAERNDEAYEDAPYNLAVKGLYLRCNLCGRQNSTDKTDALLDN